MLFNLFAQLQIFRFSARSAKNVVFVYGLFLLPYEGLTLAGIRFLLLFIYLYFSYTSRMDKMVSVS